VTSLARLPVVVLISGSGSNLQALIDGMAKGDLPIELRAVISNEADAFGLQRAAQAGIPTYLLNHREFPTREDFDAALRRLIDRFAPGLVVLAGFMRILTPDFVAHYYGRLLNIHPSLLPRFPGLHTHARVLAAGDAEHGATVHFVTEALDGGPLVLQVRIPVELSDNAHTLAARVLRQEHRIYPQAVRWFAEGRLWLACNGVVLDGGVLAAPIVWTGDYPAEK
jgi:phosphoribosylglycinamide formyltransferase 1